MISAQSNNRQFDFYWPEVWIPNGPGPILLLDFWKLQDPSLRYQTILNLLSQAHYVAMPFSDHTGLPKTLQPHSLKNDTCPSALNTQPL